MVGIACIRGAPTSGHLPDFWLRAFVVVGLAIALGLVVGFAFHFLRYQEGTVDLFDDLEMRLSFEAGIDASIAGGILMGLMVIGSLGLSRRVPGGAFDTSYPEFPGAIPESRWPSASAEPDSTHVTTNLTSPQPDDRTTPSRDPQ